MSKKPTTHDRWREMIDKARAGQDHTIADLARGCQMERSQISRFLSGKRPVSSLQLASIADYLAIELTPPKGKKR